MTLIPERYVPPGSVSVRFPGRTGSARSTLQNLKTSGKEGTSYGTVTETDSIRSEKARPEAIDRRVRDIAGKLGISGILEKFPWEVSGGQKQRCTCARALINEPKLILADEPTGALDSRSSRLLLKTMASINEKLGATILMVTHDSFCASFWGTSLS